MADVVVTLPKRFGLKAWIEEGDAAGEPRSIFVSEGGFYHWKVGKRTPKIDPGERVYVVYDGHLIGYSPLHRLRWDVNGNCYLIRLAEAEAVTIDEHIPGFRGCRYRWWEREKERPFPEWKELAA